MGQPERKVIASSKTLKRKYQPQGPAFDLAEYHRLRELHEAKRAPTAGERYSTPEVGEVAVKNGAKKRRRGPRKDPFGVNPRRESGAKFYDQMTAQARTLFGKQVSVRYIDYNTDCAICPRPIHRHDQVVWKRDLGIVAHVGCALA